MDLRTIKNYELWSTDDYFDSNTKKELKNLQGNEKEIEDRFYKDLEFGTGGIRGVIGAGTNRMNIYTVRKATQGLANFISKYGEAAKKRGVVIAYDSRHMSKEFTEEAAKVLAANGIKAFVFESLRATPVLSFAVRQLKAIAGIVVTASHNPPQYNGYKVYWEDGGQVATELAHGITREINEIYDFHQIEVIDKETAIKMGLFNIIGGELDDEFMQAVKCQSLRWDIPQQVGKDFKIVYTPLHGTGNIPVRRVLKEIGFQQVLVVPEQEPPDPNFSTVTYPNPEERKAFTLAMEMAKKENAQLIIGTDPDCDRVGAVVENKEGEYVVLTGNQIGALLVHYILSTLKEQGRLPKNGAVVKTVVTSEMGAVIAKSFGVEVFNTLTGFKYIGERIKEFIAEDSYTYLFGYEESYGYLAGTHARDKDAVVASMLICEMAAYYHSRGMNLYEGLLALYEEYGYFLEDLKSITLEGKAGMEKIQTTLNRFRENPPKEINGVPVEVMEDYLHQKRYVFKEEKEEVIQLPSSNVIKFILDDGTWLCLRPSGTEPKLKVYGGVQEETLEECIDKLQKNIDYILEYIR
ncbi:phospho-sugar mutase [Alkaliphilus hydrothermalis]|uniref:Phosphoglucomutase n=1 Tax=Alkaliphilus hydrothermalis TaxID=1482730 RepID=A0ABS2NQD0_9FIRM|nr:phospho-sugar mutase [Alkaliphilus hydrothermalis]MBM7615145.1 phosphoglucomutase [Alkaliphilus hydrothermalis]